MQQTGFQNQEQKLKETECWRNLPDQFCKIDALKNYFAEQVWLTAFKYYLM